MKIPFTEEDLKTILPALDCLSERRRNHVLEVEKMAARIGAVYMPGKENELILRAAALLHDTTKEYKREEHLAILEQYGVIPTELECKVPKSFHSMTAALLIPDRFPLFAIPEVISAVRWHTTGKADMSMYEKIIYLADYIDESRKFEECIMLRNMFWDADFEHMNDTEKYLHLSGVLIESFNVTLRELMDEGIPFHPSANDGRNFLIIEKKKILKELEKAENQ